MNLRLAAGVSALFIIAALAYSLLLLHTGLRTIGAPFVRQSWLLENNALWTLGGWLWLLAIFGWMWVLVALMWSYLPAHRIATMLQNGLTLIAAVLGIGGVVVWMNALPWAAAQNNAPQMMALVDAIALSLLGAGLFMGGGVTAWQAVDLVRLNYLPAIWEIPALLAGLLLLPAPFLLPCGWFIIAAAVLWTGWGLFLASRKAIPNAWVEWT